MVAYPATIQLLVPFQEEIGVLLYFCEEDQLTNPFHLFPEFELALAKSATVCYHLPNDSMVATVAHLPTLDSLSFLNER